MSDLTNTALGSLEAEQRLLSPVFKGAIGPKGRVGFRGELAVTFAQKFSDEARPPELAVDQVMAVAEPGSPALPFFAGFVDTLASLAPLCAVLGDRLVPTGRYFAFAGNVDIAKKYRIELGGATWHVLPLDEATVYNELLELFGIERAELKRLDTGAKLARVADAATKFFANWPVVPYAQALAEMGPVKVRENRPV